MVRKLSDDAVQYPVGTVAARGRIYLLDQIHHGGLSVRDTRLLDVIGVNTGDVAVDATPGQRAGTIRVEGKASFVQFDRLLRLGQ